MLNQRKYPQISYVGAPDYRAMKPAAKKRTREESPPSNKKSLTDEEIKILLAIESECESSTDEDGFELNRSHRSITPTTVTLKVPSRKLTAATAQVADRCQLSTRDLLALQSKIISTGGASVNQFSISTSTVWRHRSKARSDLAEKLKADFEKPEFIVAHWDSKVLTYLSGKNCDHIAILVSGFPLERPKLLGIPIITSSTGVTQKNAVVSINMKELCAVIASHLSIFKFLFLFFRLSFCLIGTFLDDLVAKFLTPPLAILELMLVVVRS